MARRIWNGKLGDLVDSDRVGFLKTFQAPDGNTGRIRRGLRGSA